MSVAAFSESDFSWSSHRATLRPANVLKVALLLLAVANIGRIPFLDLGVRQAPILLNDLCIAVVLGTGIIAMGRARSLQLDGVALAALLFAGIGAISAVAAVPRFSLSTFELIVSLAYLARWVVYFGLYVVVINCLRTDDIERTWLSIERALLLMAAFGVVQAIFLPNFAFIVYPEGEWDAQRHRLVSTVLDPNIMASMIGTVLLVQLARLTQGVKVSLWKPTLLFGALVMTLSRSGLISFLVGATFIVLMRGVTKRLLKFGVLTAVLVALSSPLLVRFASQYSKFSLSDESAFARFVTWQRALAVFFENPWFGIGFNTYGFVQDHRGFERVSASTYSAEGGLLFIAVLTGLAGLSVYLVMLWFILRRSRRGRRDPLASPSERGLFLGVSAATIAILVNSMFINSLFMPFVMELLWVLWGLTFVAAYGNRRRLDRHGASDSAVEPRAESVELQPA